MSPNCTYFTLFFFNLFLSLGYNIRKLRISFLGTKAITDTSRVNSMVRYCTRVRRSVRYEASLSLFSAVWSPAKYVSPLPPAPPRFIGPISISHWSGGAREEGFRRKKEKKSMFTPEGSAFINFSNPKLSKMDPMLDLTAPHAFRCQLSVRSLTPSLLQRPPRQQQESERCAK
ncbi:hypothetical protein L873DRAFT_227095 [Choiromyces venosus 120613-1]|uniref:Uncharacterized protein n=1 Tax=Choiromyces venosus 120613-1 TaxID=1336337 RepID=A0A3N4K1P9_9PEZI|nr:hypothetical protein L873DRAFT_227095 [Choiromyces venosus 120613-1]